MDDQVEETVIDENLDEVEQETDLDAELAAELAATSDEDEGEDSEFAVVEFNGKEYEVPKELAAGVMKNKDYTQKTMELAELRRAAEAEMAEARNQATTIKRMQDLQKENLEQFVRLQAVDTQLQQLNNINWDALFTQNPAQATKLKFQMDQLKEFRQRIEGDIKEREQTMISEHQASIAKMVADGEKVLQTKVKNWNDDMKSQIAQYATKEGYTQEEVSNLLDPRMVITLNKARLYDELVAKAKAPKQEEANLAPTRSPIRAGQSAKRNPSKMSTEEWMAWRDAEVRKKQS